PGLAYRCGRGHLLRTDRVVDDPAGALRCLRHPPGPDTGPGDPDGVRRAGGHGPGVADRRPYCPGHRTYRHDEPGVDHPTTVAPRVNPHDHPPGPDRALLLGR